MTAMATSTNANTNTNTEDFAKLFEFFSQLASGDRKAYLSKELANIVDMLPSISPTSSSSLRSLSMTNGDTSESENGVGVEVEVEDNSEHDVEVEARTRTTTADSQEMTLTRGRTFTRGRGRGQRRNSIASCARDLARFPLGGDHQFTFKLMIHELYEAGDFADMVLQVLEASQKMYKPLSEDLKSSRKKSFCGEFEEGEGGGEGEKRGEGKKMYYEGLGLGRPGEQGAERMVKKRCVGRRRSVSGPIPKEAEWIYDTAAPVFESIKVDSPKPSPAVPSRIGPRSRRASTTTTTRLRATSNAGTGRRVPTIIKEAKESPVVRYAETFLNVPNKSSGAGSSAAGRRIAAKLARAKSEEPESSQTPLSAPGTIVAFTIAEGIESSMGQKARKRRLST